MVPLYWYLILSAALFCIGLYGALARRNAIAILMGIELMLNAVNINLIAFWRYSEPGSVTGQVFASFVYVLAAAEVAVGLALIIAIYRKRQILKDSERWRLLAAHPFFAGLFFGAIVAFLFFEYQGFPDTIELGDTMVTTLSATTLLPNPIFNRVCSMIARCLKLDGFGSFDKRLFHILNLFPYFFKL